ncbi:MAG: CBS domain-containing protein [Planctomycetaceae bacterium]|nr:CBS domain-containing protein [Planctomycetaceae bacterium]
MSLTAEQVPYRRRETVGAAVARQAPPATSDSGHSLTSAAASPALARAASFAVRDVMTPKPTAIHVDDSVIQLVRLVHTKKFRHLLVADDAGLLVGVVSDRDIVRCFGPGEFPDESLLQRLRARDIMSGDVVSVSPDTTVARCIELMLGHGINCLPIVEDRRPVGILTTADLLRLLQRML